MSPEEELAVVPEFLKQGIQMALTQGTNPEAVARDHKVSLAVVNLLQISAQQAQRQKQRH